MMKLVAPGPVAPGQVLSTRVEFVSIQTLKVVKIRLRLNFEKLLNFNRPSWPEFVMI